MSDKVGISFFFIILEEKTFLCRGNSKALCFMICCCFLFFVKGCSVWGESGLNVLDIPLIEADGTAVKTSCNSEWPQMASGDQLCASVFLLTGRYSALYLVSLWNTLSAKTKWLTLQFFISLLRSHHVVILIQLYSLESSCISQTARVFLFLVSRGNV